MDGILWCYHSNETSSAVLSHGTIYSLGFYKKMITFGIFFPLANFRSERVYQHFLKDTSPARHMYQVGPLMRSLLNSFR